MLNLNTIEKELTSLLDYDKKNWTHVYLLLKKVEEERLWEEKYKSYTQWVKDFCIKTKTHESIIWSRKKAGKVYESYYKVMLSKGEQVASIEDVDVSADSLVILDKINKYDENIASNLVQKVLNKEITKKDLRELYKSIRPDVPSCNPHNKVEKNTTNEELEKVSVTASQIVSVLYEPNWLGVKQERKYFKTSLEQDKYRVFTEFPVFVGTSRKSRRMDMLVSENITSENVWDLNLHCVEIKVSKGDLLGDTKYTEYADFVDYMWLAIPVELELVAKDNVFNDCGIIVIKDNKATIVKKAAKLSADRKIDTLTNIALKLI